MPHTILLVEDEAIIAMDRARTLEKHGFVVRTAPSGEDAIRIVDDGPRPELILMDIDLGAGCDGTEAAQIILEHHDIPIVFLTNHSEKSYVDKVRKITGYGYILKNSGEFVLVESILMAFRLHDAHRKISESESKYRAAFKISPDSININRLDGVYADINDGFTRLTGYTSEDVLGRSSLEIDIWAVPEDREKLVDGLRRYGQVENLESVFRCRDGSLKTALMSARIIPFEGEPHILSITRDISEKKAVEEELKESAKRFRSLFDQAADGILTGTAEGIITDANVSICRISGYSRDELVGRPIDIIFPEPELERQPLRYDLVHSGEVVQKERTLKTKNGALVPVLMNTKKVTEECLQAIIHDISGIRAAEQALRESEERFRLAIEGSRDGLWDWDLRTGEVYHSDRFAVMLGYAPGKIPFTRDAWLALVHPDDRELERRTVDNYLKSGTGTYESLFRLKKADGGWCWISSRGKALFDDDGKAVRFLGFNTDVTALKELLEEKEYLLREIHHRVKNNLAMVTALINMKQSVVGDRVDLSDLVNQISAIRIVHEKLYAADESSINLKEYARSLLAEVFSAASMFDVRIEIDMEDAVLPVRTVIPLGLILNELATNAVKHGFIHGEPALFSIRIAREAAGGDYSLVIANSGRPFTGKGDFETMGSVGLRLVNTLVGQLRGSLTLEKEPSARFTLRFPAPS